MSRFIDSITKFVEDIESLVEKVFDFFFGNSLDNFLDE